MANFDISIGIVLGHEGGISNHKNDKGGLTNFGITFKLFKLYAKSLGLEPTAEALKNISIKDAKEIYFQEFWQKMRGNEWKDQQLANIVFDAYVNTGVRAIQLLQKHLGVNCDFKVGPQTLAAINSANPKVLFDSYKEARIMYYEGLVKKDPTQEDFIKGWKNRVAKFIYK